MYCLDTLDFHPGKLKLRLLVQTGKLNCNIKLYTDSSGVMTLKFQKINWVTINNLHTKDVRIRMLATQ